MTDTKTDFKPLLFFLLRFFLFYIILSYSYNAFLLYYAHLPIPYSDPITHLVSDQTAYLLRLFGYSAESYQVPKTPMHCIYIGSFLATYINEGCNAFSIMIIFCSFIFAFYNGILKTFGFIFSGLVLLHIINIIRITLITITIVDYPSYSTMAHDFLFPAIMYGSIFLLWIIWIYHYTQTEKKADEV